MKELGKLRIQTYVVAYATILSYLILEELVMKLSSLVMFHFSFILSLQQTFSFAHPPYPALIIVQSISC